MNQHERIVVDVDDATLRRSRLGNLMRVVHGRQPGADVKQLADACLRYQVSDGRDQKTEFEWPPGLVIQLPRPSLSRTMTFDANKRRKVQYLPLS
jgi:hypothetical protein